MSEPVLITIGSPVIFSPNYFDVQIIDSDGNIIFQGPNETNAPFLPILAPGNYTLVVGYNGISDDSNCNTLTCFTVPDPCDCPSFESMGWAVGDTGIPYLTGIISLTGGVLPPCGLHLSWQNLEGQPTGSSTITDISELGYIDGVNFSLKWYLGSADGYSVQFYADCCSTDPSSGSGLMPCASYTFSASAGTTCYTYNIIIIKADDDKYYFQINILTITGAPPLADLVMTYNQVNVNQNAADSGTMTIVIPPDAAINTPFTAPIALNPNLNFINPTYGGNGIVYTATTEPTGCPGHTFENSVIYYP